jgi:hypothetical protein
VTVTVTVVVAVWPPHKIKVAFLSQMHAGTPTRMRALIIKTDETQDRRKTRQRDEGRGTRTRRRKRQQKENKRERGELERGGGCWLWRAGRARARGAGKARPPQMHNKKHHHKHTAPPHVGRGVRRALGAIYRYGLDRGHAWIMDQRKKNKPQTTQDTSILTTALALLRIVRIAHCCVLIIDP